MILIHRWQAEAFGDPAIGALISFFDYWHSVRVDELKRAGHLNEVAQGHGDRPTQDMSLLQYHTLDDLEQALMGIAKRTKLKGLIRVLEQAGIISRHRNPNDRYKFDRTTYYLFHDDVVNRYLEARSLAKSQWSKTTHDPSVEFTYSWVEFDPRWSAADPRWNANDRTITEITSETSSLITPETRSPLTPLGRGEYTSGGYSNEMERSQPEQPETSTPVADQKETPAKAETGKRAKSSAAARARRKETSDHEPEAFAQLWAAYGKFAAEVAPSIACNQLRWKAIDSWDSLMVEGDAPADVAEGVAWYIDCKRIDFKANGYTTGVAHFERHLRNRTWATALEHKRNVGGILPTIRPRMTAKQAEHERNQAELAAWGRGELQVESPFARMKRRQQQE
ncbi:MAG: hypothetical protein DCF32_15030 [Leptolyngbya sp.]|nr:MAG: hypothetical protein DCF32_15030 [Leptolyngbya sp.]